jgi:predicted AAA+ superfamily ATPase
MVKRHLANLIKAHLKNFPAVALLGARQSGKTTLAKTFSELYFDLELEQDKLRLDLQWDEVAASKAPVILDEAQNFPEIFPRIRAAVDQNRKTTGRFLILGSVSPGLMRQVSEFLTGRIAVVELSPLALNELPKKSIDDLWLMGGFPDGGILKREQYPQWQRNYLDLLAMRDLPIWGLPATAPVTKRFFKMLAASHGFTWNASMIGKSMGLSYHTVNSYLDFLEQTYLIRKLAPYAANIKKRLIKSPKVYWRDSGLLHALMDAHDAEDLIVQPWVGLSWEGWVIEQVLTGLNNRGVHCEPFFFRTADGFELDLVLRVKGRLWAFEMKLTTSPGKRDLDRVRKTAAMIGADRIVLVSRSNRTIRGQDTITTGVRGLLSLIPEIQ